VQTEFFSSSLVSSASRLHGPARTVRRDTAISSPQPPFRRVLHLCRCVSHARATAHERGQYHQVVRDPLPCLPSTASRHEMLSFHTRWAWRLILHLRFALQHQTVLQLTILRSSSPRHAMRLYRFVGRVVCICMVKHARRPVPALAASEFTGRARRRTITACIRSLSPPPTTRGCATHRARFPRPCCHHEQRPSAHASGVTQVLPDTLLPSLPVRRDSHQARRADAVTAHRPSTAALCRPVGDLRYLQPLPAALLCRRVDILGLWHHRQ